MRAAAEIANLQAKVASGTLDPDEPIFVLRARDVLAAGLVYQWATLAEEAECPQEKLDEARACAAQMDAWPVKRSPGRPETLKLFGDR